MQTKEFLEQSEKNETLADYLDAIAQEALPEGASRSVAAGLDFLFVVAAAALLKVVQHNLSERRSLDEVILRRCMEEEIAWLVSKGYSKEQALKAVLAVSKAVTVKPPDDNVLKAGIALLTKKSGL